MTNAAWCILPPVPGWYILFPNGRTAPWLASKGTVLYFGDVEKVNDIFGNIFYGPIEPPPSHRSVAVRRTLAEAT